MSLEQEVARKILVKLLTNDFDYAGISYQNEGKEAYLTVDVSSLRLTDEEAELCETIWKEYDRP